MKKIMFLSLILLIMVVSVFAITKMNHESSKARNNNDFKDQKKITRAGKMKLVIPDETWEPLFIEVINDRANRSRLNSLRKYSLPEGDFEVRIWEGFGLMPLQGYIISYKQGKWKAFHLPPLIRKTALEELESSKDISEKQKNLREIKQMLLKQKETIPLGEPKSRWEQCWKRLENEGILTLPDSSQLKDEVRVLDGTSYVVEINKDGIYRTYRYGNPQYQKWVEAEQMLNIVSIFKDEFNIKIPHWASM